MDLSTLRALGMNPVKKVSHLIVKPAMKDSKLGHEEDLVSSCEATKEVAVASEFPVAAAAVQVTGVPAPSIKAVAPALAPTKEVKDPEASKIKGLERQEDQYKELDEATTTNIIDLLPSTCGTSQEETDKVAVVPAAHLVKEREGSQVDKTKVEEAEQALIEQVEAEHVDLPEEKGQPQAGQVESEKAELQNASEQLQFVQVEAEKDAIREDNEQIVEEQTGLHKNELQQDGELTQVEKSATDTVELEKDGVPPEPELGYKEEVESSKDGKQSHMEEQIEIEGGRLPANEEAAQQRARADVEKGSKEVLEVVEVAEQQEDGQETPEAVQDSKQQEDTMEGSTASDSEGSATCTPASNAPTLPSRNASGLDLVWSFTEEVASEAPQTCHVSCVCDTTQPGECLGLIGADPALGSWEVQKAVRLTTSAASFPTWSGDVVPPAAGSEFKLLIVKSSGEVTWEPIPGNRVWPVDAPLNPLAVFGR